MLVVVLLTARKPRGGLGPVVENSYHKVGKLVAFFWENMVYLRRKGQQKEYKLASKPAYGLRGTLACCDDGLSAISLLITLLLLS